jgi:hypothetical protein
MRARRLLSSAWACRRMHGFWKGSARILDAQELTNFGWFTARGARHWAVAKVSVGAINRWPSTSLETG